MVGFLVGFGWFWFGIFAQINKKLVGLVCFSKATNPNHYEFHDWRPNQ
jgi:hypothetical protein